jgi:hypothetical protein
MQYVTRTAVMEQLSKHPCNSETEKFSMWSAPRYYRKDKEDRLSRLSFETPAC